MLAWTETSRADRISSQSSSDALALSAAEFVGEAAAEPGVKLYVFEQLLHLTVEFFPRSTEEDFQRTADDARNPLPGIEGGVRILKDELQRAQQLLRTPRDR